jgi:hypothetical protein
MIKYVIFEYPSVLKSIGVGFITLIDVPTRL